MDIKLFSSVFRLSEYEESDWNWNSAFGFPILINYPLHPAHIWYPQAVTHIDTDQARSIRSVVQLAEYCLCIHDLRICVEKSSLLKILNGYKRHIRLCLCFEFNLGKMTFEARQSVSEHFHNDAVDANTCREWFVKKKTLLSSNSSLLFTII